MKNETLKKWAFKKVNESLKTCIKRVKERDNLRAVEVKGILTDEIIFNSWILNFRERANHV